MESLDSQINAGTIRLRPAGLGDLPALFEHYSDADSNDMAGTKPRTREEFFAAWKRNLSDPAINVQVIEMDGLQGSDIVGSIARFQADWEGGRHEAVGYWIVRPHWGKGIASRALGMFLAEEPRRPLHATVALTNAPSRRILEKCGFRCLGVRMGEESERFLAREFADFVLE